MKSRHRPRLASGGLDFICLSCYGVIKGEQSSPIALKNANGGILKKSKSGIDRTEEMAYY